MSVGRVGDEVSQIGFKSLQYRTLQIGSQQCAFDCIVLTILLRQQQVVFLKNGVPDNPLNLCTQATFTIKALVRCCTCQKLADQTIQRVVAIAAEQDWL
ncbi:hypothetical protein D3C85_1505870 [compost metagenome]